MNENIVEGYGWSSAQGPHSCNYLAPRVLELLAGLHINRVLDLGAGNGSLCGELAANGYDTVGVEFDAEGVTLARRAHPRVPFHRFGVQDDPAELMQREEPFDAVVSTEVIEHLFAPHLLPRYAAAALRPGGYLVISTPYHGYLKNLALSLAGAWDKHFTALWHGGHIKFWSERTLTQLLEANGFAVQRCIGVGRLPWLWKSMILIARKA
jgi:2-polyprenyl-3-methyl-5-hydroxy-6-metoxy-1,4-benzoquinol methylase